MLRIDQITTAIIEKQDELLDELLSTCTAEDLNQHNQNGWTPLTLATAVLNLHATTKLLEKKVNVNLPAAQIKPPYPKGDIFFEAFTKKYKLPPSGLTAFYIASISSNAEHLKLLIRYKADVNITPTDFKTPLMNSIILADLEAFDAEFDIIMTGNPNVNLMSDNLTPIFVAVEKNRIRMVRELLKKKARTDDIVIHLSLLAAAANMGNPEMGELLLSDSSLHKVNFKSGPTSALNIAAVNDHGPFVKMLLKSGIKDQPPSNNPDSFNTLQRMGQNQKLNIIRAFLDSPKFISQDSTPIDKKTAITTHSFDAGILCTLTKYGTPIKFLKEIDNVIESDEPTHDKISHQMAITIAKMVTENKISAFDSFDILRPIFCFLSEWHLNYSKQANSFKDLASLRSFIATQKSIIRKLFSSYKSSIALAELITIGAATQAELFKHFYSAFIKIGDATSAINPMNLTAKQLSDYLEDLAYCLTLIGFFAKFIPRIEKVQLKYKPEVELKKLLDEAKGAIETLIKKIKNPTSSHNETKRSSVAVPVEIKEANNINKLTNAIREGTKEGIKEEIDALIEQYSKEELDSFDENGWTPLILAVATGNEHVAQKLLGHGADANLKIKEIKTPFPTINPILIELLKKLNLGTSPTKGITAFYLAGLINNDTLMHSLIKHNAKIELADEMVYGLIIIAIKDDIYSLFITILNANPETTSAICKDGSLIYLSISFNRLGIMETLLNAGTSPDIEYENASPLETAITKNNISAAEQLLIHGANIEGKSTITPLMFAAKCGNATFVKFLLKNGANCFTKNQTTALHLAAENGHAETVRALLLAMKDDINAKNADGYTALQLACKHDHEDVINVFIDPNKPNPTMQTITPDKKKSNVYHLEMDSTKTSSPNSKLLKELATLGAPLDILKELNASTNNNDTGQTISLSTNAVHTIAKIICDNAIALLGTENCKDILNFYREWRTIHASTLTQCKNQKDFNLAITDLKKAFHAKPINPHHKNLQHTMFILFSELVTGVYQTLLNIELFTQEADIKKLNDTNLDTYLQDVLFCENQLLKQCNDLTTGVKHFKLDITTIELGKKAVIAVGTLRCNIAQEQEKRLKEKNQKNRKPKKQKPNKPHKTPQPAQISSQNIITPSSTQAIDTSLSRAATPPPKDPTYNELLTLLTEAKTKMQALEQMLKQEQVARDLAELKAIEMEEEAQKSLQQAEQSRKTIEQLVKDKNELIQQKHIAEQKQRLAETKEQMATDIKNTNVIKSAKQKQQMQTDLEAAHAEIARLKDENTILEKTKKDVETTLNPSYTHMQSELADAKEYSENLLNENITLQFDNLNLKTTIACNQQQIKALTSKLEQKPSQAATSTLSFDADTLFLLTQATSPLSLPSEIIHIFNFYFSEIPDCFLCGSAVTHIARNEMQNIKDYDFVGTCSDPSILLKLGFKPTSHHIQGCEGTLYRHDKIDFLCVPENKLDLIKNCKNRDIHLLYCDRYGNVFDPSGMGINHVKNKILSLGTQAELRLREDPRRVLRILKAMVYGDMPDNMLETALQNFNSDWITDKVAFHKKLREYRNDAHISERFLTLIADYKIYEKTHEQINEISSEHALDTPPIESTTASIAKQNMFAGNNQTKPSSSFNSDTSNAATMKPY